MEKLTKAEAKKFKKILKEEFPWLDTNQEVNGGDLVDHFSSFYQQLKAKTRHNLDDLHSETCCELLKKIYDYLYLDEEEHIYSKDVIEKCCAEEHVYPAIRNLFQNYDLEPVD